MKLSISLENKRAKITIVKIQPINTALERKIYPKILELGQSYNEAKKMNDTRSAKLYQGEMHRLRELLRTPRHQVYNFKVFVKKYNKSINVELEYDHRNNTILHKQKFFKDVVDEAIRGIRSGFARHNTPQKFGGIIVHRQGDKEHGWVFAEDGMVLKAHVKKNIKTLYDGKAPTLKKKYIGIELEFCAPIKEEQFAIKLFQKGIHKFAQLKTDGSLRPKDKENGFELAILLEESGYKRGLKAITDVLQSIKAVAKDRRCGLHVHLDMRRRDKDLVYNNLVACQYALLSIVDPVRYNNEFCRIVDTRQFPTEFTGERHERYKTINAAAYYKYKTLEIRMHEGSVSFDEISHWVDLLIKIASYPKKLKNDVTRLPTLKERFKLKKKLYNYTLERSCSFQVQNSDQVQNMREDIANLTRRRSRPASVESIPPLIVPDMPSTGISSGTSLNLSYSLNRLRDIIGRDEQPDVDRSDELVENGN